jgi:hypothetical protein
MTCGLGHVPRIFGAGGVDRWGHRLADLRIHARARRHQLAEIDKHLGSGQEQVAAAMTVTIARVSPFEHGVVTSAPRPPPDSTG